MRTNTNARRGLGMLLSLALALLPSVAGAKSLLPPDEGFMKEPKSVAYRLYSLSSKSDIGLYYALSMKNKLTQHNGGALTFDQQIGEYFAIDVFADAGAGTLTNLVTNIRFEAGLDPTNPSRGRMTTTGSDLADAGALIATGQVGLRFTPIYGKMSLSSELPVHFNFYVAAGVGAAYVQFNDILTCQSNLDGNNHCPGGSSPSGYRSQNLTKVGFNVGGGLRLYITQLLSLRVEVRDVLFPDQYLADVNFKSPVGTGTVTSSGVSQTPLVLLGIGFLL